jgi:hypothetical protein
MLNKVFFKEVLIGATLLAASGYTVLAQAHCVENATITNNSNAYQMDVHVLNCPAGTTGVSGKVSNQTGASVGIEVGYGNTHVTSTIDSTPVGVGQTSICNAAGDIAFTGGAAGSSLVTRNGGPGLYTVMVSKNSASNATYDMAIHCVGNDVPSAPSNPLGADWDIPLNH